MEIVVAGTANDIMMVEGGAKEISEDVFLDAVAYAHGEVKKIVAAIDQLAKKAGKAKREYPLLKTDDKLDKWVRKNFAKGSRQGDARHRQARAQRGVRRSLARRRAPRSSTKKDDPHVRSLIEDPKSKEFDKIIKAMEEDELRTMVVDEKIRPDGRKPDEIRPDLVQDALRAARARLGRVHPRSDAGVHRRDAGLDQRRAAPRRDPRDSQQALHALLQLPAVLGR